MSVKSKEYYDLIESARDDQTIHSIELVDDGDDSYIPSGEVNDCAINYMDTLRMERCEGEQPVYEMRPMPKEKVIVDKYKDTFDGFTMPKLSGKDLHVTADVVISLPECDGMNMEFLFAQPSHGEYLEDISYEFDIDY